MTSTISTTSISSASSSVNSSSHSHSISSSSSSISTDSHSHWDLLQSALLHPVWSAVSKPVMVVTFAIAAFISGRWMYHRTLRRHQIRSVPCGQYDLNSSSYRSASDIFEQSLINYTIKKRMKKRRELLKKEGKMSEEEIIKQLSKEQSHGLFHPHNSNSIINDYDDDDESDGLSDIILRNPTVEDIPEISQQNLDSFNEFNASVGLPPEFAAGLKQSTAMIQGCMDEGLEGVVAVDRKTGVIMASAFNDEIDVRPRVPGTGISTVLDFNSNIYGAVGCGPWSTRWGSVHKGIGRFILIHLLRRSLRHGARSIRLIQISAQLTALALYTSFGFESREPIHCWWGEMNSDCMTKELEAGKSRGWICRPLNFNDIIAADSMHQSCLGISRMNSLYNIIVDENNSRSKNEQSFYTSIGIFDSHGKLLAYNTGLIVLGWSIVKGEGEEKFNIFKYLLANAYQLHQSSSPPRPPPKLHTLARLYPSIDHWLQHDARIRIQRSENLMVLGEWQPVKHQQYIYCCSIVY